MTNFGIVLDQAARLHCGWLHELALSILRVLGLLALDVVAQRPEVLLDALADPLALAADEAGDQEPLEVLILVELAHEELWVPEQAGQEQVEAILHKQWH